MTSIAHFVTRNKMLHFLKSINNKSRITIKLVFGQPKIKSRVLLFFHMILLISIKVVERELTHVSVTQRKLIHAGVFSDGDEEKQ